MKIVDVPEPSLVRYYNKNMAEMTGWIKIFQLSYSCSIQKMVDAFFHVHAIVKNTWLLYRSSSSHDDEPMDQLGEMVNTYRMKYSLRQ